MSDASRPIAQVLAADFCCRPEDFFTSGVTVAEAQELPGRRLFPFRSRTLSLASMGIGVVVCCNRDRLAWARQHLSCLTRDDLFAAPTIAALQSFVQQDGQTMAGPDLKFVCTADTFRTAPDTTPAGVHVELYEAERIGTLYEHSGFHNALSRGPGSARPDVLAAVARSGSQVIGIAGVSADCDCLWQIGIDVVEPWQRRGLGQVLLGCVTQAVLAAGKLPYYSTWMTNIASQRLAGGLGYRIAWVELYAR